MLVFIFGLYFLITLAAPKSIYIDRIINGTKAEQGAFPSTVGLLSTGKSFKCTGNLITLLMVLTAGHCFLDGELKYAIAGEIYIDADSQYKQTRMIIYRKIHPAFESSSDKTYDLAVLTVNESFVMTERVQYIPLCEKPPNFGIICKNAGWGGTRFVSRQKATASKQLNYHKIKVVDFHDCRQIFFQPDLICTFSKHSTGYFGDSGGPLICNEKLCGVLSAYSETHKIVNLFANVPKSYVWINSNGTKGESNQLRSRHLSFKMWIVGCSGIALTISVERLL